MHGKLLASAMVMALVATALFTTTAAATPATAPGVASTGSAHVVRDGHTFGVADVGQCSLTGPQQAQSPGVTRVGIVSYGPATATCTTDPTAHTSKSTANGTAFALTALQAYGGPQIRIANYQVTCTATTNGTNAAWQFSGLTGITVPQQVPNDFVIPVKSAGGNLLANVTLNEVILPNPNDGSITLNMVHIALFPNGTPPGTVPMSGDVYVGSTACSPTT